ncbi:hypothetical protein ACMGEE_17335 [Erwinia sp. DT-104]|jgi:hypothetical protein|uniref:Transposase n=1 Tax=Erwinia plantamica TaxID=3237104 RepID=A0ABW7CPD1_9GAMM|nr:hypothetical protein [Erwinia sp. BC051422]MDN8543656.1 hypothetical protein [Erwinia sp. BC051422]
MPFPKKLHYLITQCCYLKEDSRKVKREIASPAVLHFLKFITLFPGGKRDIKPNKGAASRAPLSLWPTMSVNQAALLVATAARPE